MYDLLRRSILFVEKWHSTSYTGRRLCLRPLCFSGGSCRSLFVISVDCAINRKPHRAVVKNAADGMKYRYRSQILQGVLPYLFTASVNDTRVVPCVQLLNPRQFSELWYLADLGPSQIYT